jgi:hypothetical protein
VLTTYPLQFLQGEVGISFGNYTPEIIQAMEAGEVQQLIDTGEIRLPNKLEHSC